MIRFAVILFFFFHLAILLKAPRLKWAGRIIGGGTALFFFGMIFFSVEENSDFVFVFTGTLAALSVLAAEIVASLFKKDEKSS